MVLSFSPVAEVDFSFLAEAELDAARAEPAVLGPALAWFPVAEEEERVCFEVAALAAGALVAEPVAGAAAAELGPACSALVAALAADEPAAELVVGVAAEALVADAVVVLVAGALVAELVAGVAAEALVADAVVVLVAGALVAELVAGVAAEPELACSALAEWFAADELAAELVAGARAAVLPVSLQAGWPAVDCDSAEHFAGPRPVDRYR